MIRSLIIGAGVLVALALPASASADRMDILSMCKTTTTGWEIWVDESDWSCGAGREAYRLTRRIQRQRGGLRPGDTFLVRYPDGSPASRARVIAWDDGSYTVRLRERGRAIVAEFTYP